MGRERRQHRRFSVNWRGRVLLSDRSLYHVVIRDVSKGGVAIDFDHVLPLKTPVNVEVTAPYKTGQIQLRAKTVVMHHTVLADGRGARLGLMFTEMSKDNIHVFSNLLQELTDKSG